MSARVARSRPLARPLVGLATLAVAAALTLTGCSDDSSKAPVTETIKITITEDAVSPLGERVEVAAGQPFKVEITADREGTLHVHSNPELEWDFTDGTTQIEATLDQPGVAEVELHDPAVVVLQLEVR